MKTELHSAHVDAYRAREILAGRIKLPSGSGAGAGGRSNSEPEPPPARPMADWELWAHMPKATVREAVLLSLGLEPRPPVLTWTQYEAPRSYAEPGREYERRLMLAAAHVDASGPLRPLVSMPFPEDATVSLPEFGGWAHGLGWELPERFPRQQAPALAPEPTAPPVVAESASVVSHSTKTRRDSLTPVIELAQGQCRNPKDTAEVWAALLVLAEKKSAPLIGATEDGLQYLNNGIADIFKRDSLRKRLSR